ncbi:Hypothetical predicted protein [Xyrichtys novacula]|uniref:Uncharacterized protein n=1 Tax=Xyrichtys novacula TaxID=13765 RepID=A0AAV1FDI6_XYRNO|nr:Hypothetical predicted protein [Xyrichtys novacula]
MKGTRRRRWFMWAALQQPASSVSFYCQQGEEEENIEYQTIEECKTGSSELV